MKKQIALLLALTFFFTLTGCRSTPDASQTSSATEQTVQTGTLPVKQRPLVAVSIPAATVTETAQDGTVLFRYTSQHMQLIAPDSEVADKVILDFLNRIDKSNVSAEDLRQQAVEQFDSAKAWTPYAYRVIYNPTRVDRGILSLYGTELVFSGESHPNYNCLSVNYDLITGEPLTLGAILTHENALPSLKALLLSQLNAIKEEKYLREDYKSIVGRRFEGEESYDEDWFFTLTGLSFYFPPYEIAPYSSGTIIAEIPYEKLTGIIDDAFFPAEQEYADGAVTLTALKDTDLTQITQIAELTLDPEAENYLLQTDHAVQNLQIHYTDPETGECYTPFAVEQLTDADAVKLEISQDTAKNLTVSYITKGETVTIPLP